MNIEPLYLLIFWFTAGLGYTIGRWIERRKWIAPHRAAEQAAEEFVRHWNLQVIREAEMKERFNDESS